MSFEQYLANEGVTSDLQSKQDFLDRLLLAYKQKNISESINVFQYFHMMQKIRSWAITVPGGVPVYGGFTYTIDLSDTFPTADVEAMTKALDWGRANIDDMTQPDHWLSQDRFDWLFGELKTWLGWT